MSPRRPRRAAIRAVLATVAAAGFLGCATGGASARLGGGDDEQFPDAVYLGWESVNPAGLEVTPPDGWRFDYADQDWGDGALLIRRKDDRDSAVVYFKVWRDTMEAAIRKYRDRPEAEYPGEQSEAHRQLLQDFDFAWYPHVATAEWTSEATLNDELFGQFAARNVFVVGVGYR